MKQLIRYFVVLNIFSTLNSTVLAEYSTGSSSDLARILEQNRLENLRVKREADRINEEGRRQRAAEDSRRKQDEARIKEQIRLENLRVKREADRINEEGRRQRAAEDSQLKRDEARMREQIRLDNLRMKQGGATIIYQPPNQIIQQSQNRTYLDSYVDSFLLSEKLKKEAVRSKAQSNMNNLSMKQEADKTNSVSSHSAIPANKQRHESPNTSNQAEQYATIPSSLYSSDSTNKALNEPNLPDALKKVESDTTTQNFSQTQFECIDSEGGYRPKYKAGGPPLGKVPYDQMVSCERAILNSKSGIVCSKTGLGWMPTLHTGTLPARSDFGYVQGSSFDKFENCLLATHNSTDRICFWSGSAWSHSDLVGQQLSNSTYGSVEMCITSYLGPALAPIVEFE